MSGHSLAPGEQLLARSASHPQGESLVSPNGRYTLAMQSDGNLVLYDGPPSVSSAMWASNTAGQLADKLVMQTDGNLVIYGPSHLPNHGAIWASGTDNNGFDAKLVLQDDGNLVIYAQHPTWATGTNH